MSSEMKHCRRQLGRLGFVVTKTRGGHWRFEHPDMDGPVFGADCGFRRCRPGIPIDVGHLFRSKSAGRSD